MEDRSKTLGRKKLCYECLGAISKEHSTKRCANRSMCKLGVEDTHSIPWLENSEI